MSVTLGNPIIITSGQMATTLTPRNLDIVKYYWYQPTGESTSSLLIRKNGATGPEVVRMLVEASGQSQVLSFDEGTWLKNGFIDCMPTGTLYIHTR